MPTTEMTMHDYIVSRQPHERPELLAKKLGLKKLTAGFRSTTAVEVDNETGAIVSIGGEAVAEVVPETDMEKIKATIGNATPSSDVQHVGDDDDEPEEEDNE